MSPRAALPWEPLQSLPSEKFADKRSGMESTHQLFECLEEARRCSNSSVALAFVEQRMAMTPFQVDQSVTRRSNSHPNRPNRRVDECDTDPFICTGVGEGGLSSVSFNRPEAVAAAAAHSFEGERVRWPDGGSNLSAGISSGFSVPDVSTTVCGYRSGDDVVEGSVVTESGNCNPTDNNTLERFVSVEGCDEKGTESSHSTERREETVDRLRPQIVRPHPIKPFVPPSLVFVTAGAGTEREAPSNCGRFHLVAPVGLRPSDASARCSSTSSESSSSSSSIESLGAHYQQLWQRAGFFVPGSSHFGPEHRHNHNQEGDASVASKHSLPPRFGIQPRYLRDYKEQASVCDSGATTATTATTTVVTTSSSTMPPMSNGSSSKAKDSSSSSGPKPPENRQNNPSSTVNARTERYRQFSSGVSSNGGGGIIAAAGRVSRSIHDEEDAGGGGAASNRAQPTPLFERLVTEEVQELKAYARIIETQQRRLAELELVHRDLEGRLEIESRVRQQLEATLESREREWVSKLSDLQKDRDEWKEVVTVEQTKNARLRDQLNRKEKDIHQMLQRKYDGDATRSVRNVRGLPGDRGERTVTSASKSPEARLDLQKSPHELLEASGSVEKVRMRNAKSLLLDFFGM